MNGKRPAHVKPPAYLTPNTPVPEPAAPVHDPNEPEEQGLDPVRYGDWEKNGLAIDF